MTARKSLLKVKVGQDRVSLSLLSPTNPSVGNLAFVFENVLVQKSACVCAGAYMHGAVWVHVCMFLCMRVSTA